MSDEQGGLEERSRIPLSFSVHPEEGCHSILAPQIRGYELLQKIGEGGMGSVWRAQENNTKRQVAVKVLKFAGSIHGPARARFRREIELAANLVHPHIVRLYDPGSDNGVIYYTMELIKGQHLDEYVRHHELSRHQITELMLSINSVI